MVSALHIMSILLIVLTPVSYWPQYKKLLSLQTASGISARATLVLVLCAQSQLATMYYLFACPNYERDGDVIPTPPRLIDWLSLVQLLMQWLCSLVMLVLVFSVGYSPRGDIERHPAGETTEQTGAQTGDLVASPKNPDMTSRSAVLLITIHFALCLFWAGLAGKPTRDWLDLPFGVIMVANEVCINPLITIATGVAYGLLARSASKAPPSQTAWSRTALKLQIVVFLALAVLWPSRLGFPQRPRYDSPWLIVEWYPLVGWVCVNNAVIAAGQCIVLYAVSGRRGARATSQETQPLLGT